MQDRHAPQPIGGPQEVRVRALSGVGWVGGVAQFRNACAFEWAQSVAQGLGRRPQIILWGLVQARTPPELENKETNKFSGAQLSELKRSAHLDLPKWYDYRPEPSLIRFS